MTTNRQRLRLLTAGFICTVSLGFQLHSEAQSTRIENRERIKAANEKKKADLDAKKKKAAADLDAERTRPERDAAAKKAAEAAAKSAAEEKIAEDQQIAKNIEAFKDSIAKNNELILKSKTGRLTKEFGRQAEEIGSRLDRIFGDDGYTLKLYVTVKANDEVYRTWNSELQQRRFGLMQKIGQIRNEAAFGLQNLSAAAKEREQKKMLAEIVGLEDDVKRYQATVTALHDADLWHVGQAFVSSNKTDKGMVIYFCACDTGIVSLYTNDDKIADAIAASIKSAELGMTPKRIPPKTDSQPDEPARAAAPSGPAHAADAAKADRDEKAAEATASIAQSLLKSGNRIGYRITLKELIEKYPDTKAAKKARTALK